MFRFLTSGESHGQCLNAIIEGVPSGITIDNEFINNELARRQVGYGRGGRMLIEKDTVKILSGVRHGKSIGSPICLEIENKDWKNWIIPMNSQVVDNTDGNLNLIESKKIINVRPGHADLAGALKYNHKDIRNILERSSARETTTRVAVGAVAKSILKEFNIEGLSCVTQIGSVKSEIPNDIFQVKNDIESSDLRTSDKVAYEKMKIEIDKAKAEGDTLGGSFKIVFKNVPVGLGSHVHWDRRIDGLLAQAVMSIQAVKSVEIGLGSQVAETLGSKTHDEIFIENGQYVRKTNNAGGVESGITNGEDIVITASMKAIPTMRKPLNSIAIDKKEAVQAHFERSDTCAVAACAVVAEAMVAIVLADAMLEKFSHDSIDEMKINYQNYLDTVSKR
ncbi:TPA: chorismate synthase [Candidatus Avigastranaerophilus faecigallinarum]|nr:chorismate synthase [Candidatus Avigastranaerophilus faecigallinarum]